MHADMDAAVARLGAALGERARARMLLALLDGSQRTATDLAQAAQVGAATASVHLARLQSAGLIECESRGRYRFYRLCGGEVATLLETMAASTKKTRRVPDSLRQARSCYDHLAGALGVAVHDRMRRLGWLATTAQGYELRQAGQAALETMGVDVATARGRRRKFAAACLDWSERRPHLGGALGCAFLTMVLEKKLFVREMDSRALELTPRGRRWLREQLGVEELTTQH